MSIDGRMDAAARKTDNSKAFRNFEQKGWIDEPPTTAAERKRYNKDLAAVKNESSKNTAAAVNAGRQQLADQQRALAGKKAKKRVMPLPKGAGKTATKGGLKPLPKGGWEELSNLTDTEKRKIYHDMGVEGY